ncbi:WD40 repeat domain-containing protein [Streptomyces sp. NPDC096176]|uniref:WD40 repeat domain-containing protein n=1 Tax=Streptomyces sp. NPDC096176 TaxID=3366079 RepID=UPI00380CD6D1
MANQLGVVAGTPAELLSALLSGPPRTVLLRPVGQDPEELAELARSLREFGHLRVFVEPAVAAESEPGRPVDLTDPEAVCSADPVRVSSAYETADEDHGGLRTAWLRAGQSLIREQPPAGRALVLLAALPAAAEARVRRALTRLSEGAPWSVEWSRPGPVAALTVSAVGLVAADPTGGVRTRGDDVPHRSTASRVKAVAALDDTVLLLDERGRLHRHGGTRTPLTKAVATTLSSHPGTALAAAADTVLVGDRMGFVHAFTLAGVHQAALHSGRVTALAATASPVLSVHSGGTDGTVQVWTPEATRRRPPVTERPYPVAALHCARTPAGHALAVAWADGLAELHRLGTREVLAFRPGPPVRAVAVTPDGALAVGTDDMLTVLRPR